MLSSGYGKLSLRLSHVSALLPPLQYVLQLCKPCVSRFLLCSLSKLFHISLHTNRNTEAEPIPIPPCNCTCFSCRPLLLCSDQSALLAALSRPVRLNASFARLYIVACCTQVKMHAVRGMKNMLSVCVNSPFGLS